MEKRVIKSLCAMLRMFDNKPVKGDLNPIKIDFKFRMNRHVERYLRKNTEYYLKQEVNKNLIK